MSFKTIDMNKLKENLVARLRTKVTSGFAGERKNFAEFEFDVELLEGGTGMVWVEFYDLMDGFIGTEAKKTLERAVHMDPNTDVINSGHTRPGYRDFRHGAMPCVYVEFSITL